ncbi:hypothetical protein M885DRAFT_513300 [Pelagophyceae sp. CCMP2097]|nr:hypothetical protein M885DRAFT_513300 [Pelagophyceae sp. CCMP2097]
MSGFNPNGGQDWSTVNAGKTGRPGAKAVTPAEKAAEMQKAQRSGQVNTSAKAFPSGNKSAGGIGPMGTSAGAGARKIEDETETFVVQKAGLGFAKALMQARMALKMTQKDLGTKVNEKPQIVQEYESGKAVPNPSIILKFEKALGVKLPRPPKVVKAKDTA